MSMPLHVHTGLLLFTGHDTVMVVTPGPNDKSIRAPANKQPLMLTSNWFLTPTSVNGCFLPSSRR